MARPISRYVVLLGLVVLGALAGCNSQGNDAYDRMVTRRQALRAEHKEEIRTPLQVAGVDGILRGKVVFDGEAPAPQALYGLPYHEDKEECLKGGPAETARIIWAVNKENAGVGGVVVWLEPPADRYFPLTEKERNRAGETILIDQPHCAFLPHVVSIFPSYFDGAKQVKTGQKLEIRNSARVAHSIQWNPSPMNDGGNRTVAPKTSIELLLNPQPYPLLIGCSFHHWMQGVIWIFDHPYHTVTRDDGTFLIPNVPTDVELTFKAWHESARQPFAERKITFRPGENPPIELHLTSVPKNKK